MTLPPASSDLTSLLRRALHLHQGGQVAQAMPLYRQILATDPNHFDALHLLGAALMFSNDVTGGLALIDRALAVNPNDPAAHYNRAFALSLLQRHHDAVAALDAALLLKPEYGVAHFQRGNALRALARHDEALVSFDRALAIDPRFADASVNRAIQLKTLGQLDAALTELERMVAIAPNNAMVHVNRASVLMRLGRFTDALKAYEATLSLTPHLAEAHFGAAECRLTLGDWEVGFAGFEWRWKTAGMAGAVRAFPQPLWLGETSLNGKTILLHAEQGLGDTIQFARYALLARDQGAGVVLEVQPVLKKLMRSLAPDIQVIGKGEALPPFDVQAPLMSLPHAFKTTPATVPVQTAYLNADGPFWAAEFQKKPGLNVGLAWSGTATHDNDRNRSSTLAAFAALGAPGLNFYGLQAHLTEDDKAAAQQFSGFTHLGDASRDFADVAAMVAALDVVVTVDTVFAHLAGALGKPVYVLLSQAVDWRWLLERSDSPWYPTAQLFRQTTLGDWHGPIAAARAALVKP